MTGADGGEQRGVRSDAPRSRADRAAPSPARREARGHRVIGLGVLLGVANLVGVRSAEERTSADGLTFAVTYAKVTRSGLETPWKVEVRSPLGFEGPVTITTTAEYFERFDFNQWYPEPSGTVLRDELLVLTFDRPQGDVLLVRFDGRASPTFGLGSAAATTPSTPRGSRRCRSPIGRWVMP